MTAAPTSKPFALLPDDPARAAVMLIIAFTVLRILFAMLLAWMGMRAVMTVFA